MKVLKSNTLNGRIVGYALIAFILVIGHACAQGITWSPPMDSMSAKTLMTPVSALSSFQLNDITVGRSGMNGLKDKSDGMVESARDGLEQPLMINHTEFESYAVKREVDMDFTPVRQLLSI